MRLHFEQERKAKFHLLEKSDVYLCKAFSPLGVNLTTVRELAMLCSSQMRLTEFWRVEEKNCDFFSESCNFILFPPFHCSVFVTLLQICGIQILLLGRGEGEGHILFMRCPKTIIESSQKSSSFEGQASVEIVQTLILRSTKTFTCVCLLLHSNNYCLHYSNTSLDISCATHFDH